MGMLIDGQWRDEESLARDGAYRRAPSVFDEEICRRDQRALRDDPERYLLVASASCPWSHRTIIVHTLKSLAATVPVKLAGGPRLQGYALDGGKPWRIPGTDRNAVHLHELYTLADPAHSGGSTVPILWDSREGRIVSNDSARIMRAFDAAPPAADSPDFTLVPADLRMQIDILNAELHDTLNNAVYRAGFATAQAAYDTAVADVFSSLDRLEARLGERRYLFGATITESDWRLFPTLVRFDAIYAVLFRCSLRRLVDYPALWAYARDLYAWKGVAETVDFDTMREQSYQNDQPNAHPIVAIAPDMDWHSPHRREHLGAARIALRDGTQVPVTPQTLTPA